MSVGKRATTVCNGCSKETDETCWWRHVTRNLHTNSGFCYDMINRDEDFCHECWEIMWKAIRAGVK